MDGSTLTYLGSIGLVVLGAVLSWIARALGDRGTRKAEGAARLESARLRSHELGRDSASKLLELTTAAWDELSTRQIQSEGTPLQSVKMSQFLRTADLIPNAALRKAADAVGRLISSPSAFEESPEFADFVLPKGPKGAAPTVVKEILAVESLTNMLNAFLREEDVRAFLNPLLEMVMNVGYGRGMTVANLYGQS